MKKTAKLLISGILGAVAVSTAAGAFELKNTYTEGQFTDVPSSEWYASEVKSTYELGLMNGIGGGLFSPDGNVTVAEAITMASRASSIYAGETIENASGEWYQMYVNYAVKKGFIDDGQFADYNAYAKRYEVAEIFAKAMPEGYFTAKNNVEAIPDVSESLGYHDEVMTLYKAGVVMGSDSYGNFRPCDSITRAEAAAIISRVALPEKRLSKTLDKISDDDAYRLVITKQMDSLKHNGINSGWVLDNTGGFPRTGVMDSYTKLVDIDNTSETAYIREFNKITTGNLVLESTLYVGNGDGVYLSYRNDAGKDIFRIEKIDSKWQVLTPDGYVPVYDIPEFTPETRFNISVDLDNGRSTVYVNYQNCGSFTLPASADERNVMNLRIGTTKESTSSVTPSKVYINANYSVNEPFEFVNGNLPINWYGNNAYVKKEALALPKDASASTSFTPVSGKSAVDFVITLPQKENTAFYINSGIKNVLLFSTDKDNFYLNGEKLYENYLGNMRYRIRFEIDSVSGKIIAKVNGRVCAEASFAEKTTSFDNITFANTSETEVQVDNVRVYRVKEYENYVPKPVVPAGEDKYNVGMNVCSLWQNGIADGWACISPYDEAMPVLGFYDEGNPETADWEIKYVVEHGIDFQAFCVFPSVVDGVMTFSNADHLFDGFMNAKYSHMTKYCIIWEAAAGASPSSLDEWKNIYVPFYTENLFKDERYMTIDNRLVMCVFNADSISSRLGGDALVKEAFDYLDEEVKKLGFDGMLYLASGGHSKDLSAMGYDGWYPYAWGTEGYSLDVNTSSMLSNAKSKNVYHVPTVSVGFNSLPWHRNRYPLMTVEDYKKAHEFVKTEYLPEYAKEEWQKNFVMLSTWNEYGEGTYIMPSGLNGFGYLDVLREAYTDEKADESINNIPDAEQRYRINHLYPQYRRLLRRQDTYIEEVKLSDLECVREIIYNAEPNVKVFGSSDVTRTANGITGVSTTDAIIQIDKIGGDIDLEKVAAIKITAKIPLGNYMEVYYTTSNSTGWAQNKSFAVQSVSNDFADYVVSTADLAAWNGNLVGLRIDPVANVGVEYTVKSAEFYSDADRIPKKMTVNGNTFELNLAPVADENGDILLPFDPETGIDFRLGIYHEWNKAEKKLTLSFKNHTVIYTAGSDKYLLDGAEKTLSSAIGMRDGLPLIPVKQLCGDVGFEYSFGDDKILSINTDSYDFYKDIPSEVPGQYEFNTDTNLEGWSPNGYTAAFVSDGALKLESVSKDPYIFSLSEDVFDAARFDGIEIKARFKYNAAKLEDFRVYFITLEDSSWSESKACRIPLGSFDSEGEWVTLKYKFTDNEKWRGTVTRLRLDPFDAFGTMEIDYIRLTENPDYVYVDPDEAPFALLNGDGEDIANPGFKGYVEWGVTGDPDPDNLGNNCYYFMGNAKPTTAEYVYSYQNVRYKPGATYIVECDMRLMSLNQDTKISPDLKTTMCANAMYLQTDGTNDHIVGRLEITAADGWKHFKFQFTVAENTETRTNDTLAFYSNPVDGNGVGYYLDNVKVTEILPEAKEKE